MYAKLYRVLLKIIYGAPLGKAPVAAVAAAATAPIVNTGIFILWGLLMVRDTLTANLANFGWSGDSVLLFLILGCAGINFLVEFALNILLSPVIVRVLQAVRQQGGSRSLDA